MVGFSLQKTVVLIGLMGAGKSRVGAALSKRMGVPFVDSDHEIEQAAGMSIPEIFERFGEADFRQGERRVVLRLLSGEPIILATGGGAFMQDDIRKAIKTNAISVWLKADLDILVDRVGRSSTRPLLKNVNPAQRLQELMDARYPIYAEADIVVDVNRGSIKEMAKQVHLKVEEFAGGDGV